MFHQQTPLIFGTGFDGLDAARPADGLKLLASATTPAHPSSHFAQDTNVSPLVAATMTDGSGTASTASGAHTPKSPCSGTATPIGAPATPNAAAAKRSTSSASSTTAPTAPTANAVVQDEAMRNVYVASLPMSFSSDDLMRLAAPFGRVESLRMFNDTKHVAATGHSYGFVLFASAAEAARAVAGLADLPLGDRRLQVRLSKASNKRIGGRKGQQPSGAARQQAAALQQQQQQFVHSHQQQRGAAAAAFPAGFAMPMPSAPFAALPHPDAHQQQQQPAYFGQPPQQQAYYMMPAAQMPQQQYQQQGAFAAPYGAMMPMVMMPPQQQQYQQPMMMFMAPQQQPQQFFAA